MECKKKAGRQGSLVSAELTTASVPFCGTSTEKLCEISQTMTLARNL